jgi:hypothetical protein
VLMMISSLAFMSVCVFVLFIMSVVPIRFRNLNSNKYFPFHNSLSFVLGRKERGGSLVYFEYLLSSMGYQIVCCLFVNRIPVICLPLFTYL